MTTLAAGPDADLRSAYSAVRALTDRLARPLSPEDQTAQSMPDASPSEQHEDGHDRFESRRRKDEQQGGAHDAAEHADGEQWA